MWLRIRNFAALSFVIAAAHVVTLGIPGILLVRTFGKMSGWASLLMGFVLGAIPIGLLSWPLRYGAQRVSASHEGVVTLVNGVPTLAGWLDWAYGTALMGLLGALGGGAFWLVWRGQLRLRAT
jgi:hypothetical protein